MEDMRLESEHIVWSDFKKAHYEKDYSQSYKYERRKESFHLEQELIN